MQLNRKLELEKDLKKSVFLSFFVLFFSPCLAAFVCLLDLFGGVEHRAYSWLLSLLSGSLGFWGFVSGGGYHKECWGLDPSV